MKEEGFKQGSGDVPKHIAIIMDGNGRWAKKRGKNRLFGHRNAINAIKESIKTSIEQGIKYLTLYAFSTENWHRPTSEVEGLISLMSMTIESELNTLHSKDIRINIIGDIKKFPSKIQEKLKHVIEKTTNNKGLVLTIAIGYSAREELKRAVVEISKKVQANEISIESIDNLTINSHLYTYDLPDVDLLIRTSGEQRISNFMLWQIAYAELYFTKTLWPDFKKERFLDAILNYKKRERRFGKTTEQIRKV